MPRKQRFKPSRKPKLEAPQAEPQSNPSNSGDSEDQIEPRDVDRGSMEASS